MVSKMYFHTFDFWLICVFFLANEMLADKQAETWNMSSPTGLAFYVTAIAMRRIYLGYSTSPT